MANADLELTRPDRIRSAYAALANLGAEGFCKLLLDPLVITISASLANPVGAQAVEAEHGALLSAFPDLRWNVEEVLECGDHTVTQLSARGTHAGPWGRFPPTGLVVHIQACEVAEWAAGRVVVRQLYWDRHSVWQQLDLL
ncbi:MAG: hypothetical protein NVS3B21_12180 [Acidimicrobiales bacterium]